MTVANVNVTKVLFKRGNTTQNNNYTGVRGEITVDTTLNTLRIHDGTLRGGSPITAGNMAGSYDNSNVAAYLPSDTTITSIQANIAAANAAISSIAGIDVSLIANAATQQTQINLINANVANIFVPNLLAVTSDILPSANITYSLGNQNCQWKELWVSGNTIYIDSIPISISGNALLVNGSEINGGNPFDQSLNTIDRATFFNVSLNGVEDDDTPAVDFFSAVTNNHKITLANDWTLKLKARADGVNEGHLWLESGQNTAVKIHGEGSTIDLVASDGTSTATVNLDKDGKLTLPNGTTFQDFGPYGSGLVIRAAEGRDISLNSFVGNSGVIVNDTNGTRLYTYNEAENRDNFWDFDFAGNITFPDNTVQTTAYPGASSINNLTDVDTTSTPPSVGQVLKWNGTNWVPATDSTTGGGGTEADTLDGQHGDYYLNYSNFSNVPDLSIYATTTDLGTLEGNVGSFYTWANLNFGNSSYTDNNVAAYLSLQNIAAQLQSDYAEPNVANVAYIKNKPDLTVYSTVANAAVQATWLANLEANVATQAAGINTLNANIGAYQLYANTTTYSNANVAAYLTTATINTTGNITAGNLTAAGNLYTAGGILRTTSTSANVFNSIATTVYIAGAATIGTYIGNASGVTQLNGNVQGSTNGFAIGYRDIPQLSFTGNTTISLSDAGKHYYSTQSTGYNLTVANNATVAFSIGTAINVINQGTGTITIVPGTGVTMYLAGNSTSGARTLSSYGVATIQKVASDTWFLIGVGVA